MNGLEYSTADNNACVGACCIRILPQVELVILLYLAMYYLADCYWPLVVSSIFSLSSAVTFNPLTHISPFFWHYVFMHPKRIGQKTGSITHAWIKLSLAQETLVL